MKQALPSELTLSQLAMVLGISLQAVNTAERLGHIKKLSRGTYPLSAIADYVAHQHKTIRGAGAGLGLTEARAIYVAEQTRKVKLEREKLEGTLVRRDLVVRCWSNVVVALRAHLLGLPLRCVSRLILCRTEVEMQGILTQLVDDMCDELVNAEFEYVDDEELLAGPDPLTKIKKGNGAARAKN